MSGEDEGRDRAFTNFYRTHYAAVLSYCRVCMPAAEVDDTVAETFVVAWRRFDDIPTDWTRAWLLGVTRNVVRARNRAYRRNTNFIDQLIAARPTTQTTNEATSVSIEELTVLRTAFRELSDSDQELLVLAGPYGLTAEELAVTLDVSVNAATVRLHRARRRLRGAYEAQHNDDDGAAA